MQLSVFKIKTLIDKYKREQQAADYLLFSSSRNYIYFLLPLFVATTSFFVRTRAKETAEVTASAIGDFQGDLVDNYILWLKFGTLVICSFLLSYQWAEIMKNGTYGYWLSLGIERPVFFANVIVLGFLRLLFSAIIGFITITYIAGLNFTFSEVIKFVTLHFLGIFIMICLAVLFAELVESSELASILLVITYGSHLVFSDTNLDFINMIIIGELNYDNSDFWLTLVVSILSCVFFFYAALLLHSRRDIEL